MNHGKAHRNRTYTVVAITKIWNLKKVQISRQRHLFATTRGSFVSLPKMKCSELISALLQITIDTDDTTDRVNAPTVPSWNLSPSPIFVFALIADNKTEANQFQIQNVKTKSKNKTNNKRKTFKQTALKSQQQQDYPNPENKATTLPKQQMGKLTKGRNWGVKLKGAGNAIQKTVKTPLDP